MIFSKVVSIKDGMAFVTDVYSDGGIHTIEYPEAQLPKQVKDKISLLKYLPENDNEGVEGVGIRVGSDTFWVT